MGETMVGGYLVVVLLGLVLAVCWVLLPFAMFGIKPLLREVRDEQQRTNELLRKLVERSDHRS